MRATNYTHTLIIFLLFFNLIAKVSGQALIGILDSSQLQRKTMQAVRITEPPRIDGIADEAIWEKAQAATDFVEYTPRNGIKAPYRTEVRFVYDDVALYALAIVCA